MELTHAVYSAFALCSSLSLWSWHGLGPFKVSWPEAFYMLLAGSEVQKIAGDFFLRRKQRGSVGELAR